MMMMMMLMMQGLWGVGRVGFWMKIQLFFLGPLGPSTQSSQRQSFDISATGQGVALWQRLTMQR